MSRTVVEKLASVKDTSPFCYGFLRRALAERWSPEELHSQIVKSAKNPIVAALWDSVFEKMSDVPDILGAAVKPIPNEPKVGPVQHPSGISKPEGSVPVGFGRGDAWDSTLESRKRGISKPVQSIGYGRFNNERWGYDTGAANKPTGQPTSAPQPVNTPTSVTNTNAFSGLTEMPAPGTTVNPIAKQPQPANTPATAIPNFSSLYGSPEQRTQYVQTQRQQAADKWKQQATAAGMAPEEQARLMQSAGTASPGTLQKDYPDLPKELPVNQWHADPVFRQNLQKFDQAVTNAPEQERQQYFKNLSPDQLRAIGHGSSETGSIGNEALQKHWQDFMSSRLNGGKITPEMEKYLPLNLRNTVNNLAPKYQATQPNQGTFSEDSMLGRFGNTMERGASRWGDKLRSNNAPQQNGGRWGNIPQKQDVGPNRFDPKSDEHTAAWERFKQLSPADIRDFSSFKPDAKPEDIMRHYMRGTGASAIRSTNEMTFGNNGKAAPWLTNFNEGADTPWQEGLNVNQVQPSYAERFGNNWRQGMGGGDWAPIAPENVITAPLMGPMAGMLGRGALRAGAGAVNNIGSGAAASRALLGQQASRGLTSGLVNSAPLMAAGAMAPAAAETATSLGSKVLTGGKFVGSQVAQDRANTELHNPGAITNAVGSFLGDNPTPQVANFNGGPLNNMTGGASAMAPSADEMARTNFNMQSPGTGAGASSGAPPGTSVFNAPGVKPPGAAVQQPNQPPQAAPTEVATPSSPIQPSGLTGEQPSASIPPAGQAEHGVNNLMKDPKVLEQFGDQAPQVANSIWHNLKPWQQGLVAGGLGLAAVALLGQMFGGGDDEEGKGSSMFHKLAPLLGIGGLGAAAYGATRGGEGGLSQLGTGKFWGNVGNDFQNLGSYAKGLVPGGLLGK